MSISRWRRVVLGVAGALSVVVAAGTVSAAAAPLPPLPAVPGIDLTGLHPVRSCAQAPAGSASCHSMVLANAGGTPAVTPGPRPGSYGPVDLHLAYALRATAPGTPTIAIVDAFDHPNAEADLAVYRSQYGLPACTTANRCFRKVDQNGGTRYPKADVGWAQEISLDLDVASATCPNCRILLVETASASYTDLGTGVNRAATLRANAISNSYGGDEPSNEAALESRYYNHPGIAVTASTGDSGFGSQYPASSRYVTAVGGTTLVRTGVGRGWAETAWAGTGSGCSAVTRKPTWQTDTGCPRRSAADVSAVADPATGVAVYDSYGAGVTGGWMVFGGTSAAAPLIAGTYALAGNAASINAGAYPYAHRGGLNDITAGTNGVCQPTYLCTAGTGYDGPTGLGTPNGTSAF